ncbi:MAG: CDP-diacylglycerol--glycerol-3-phosphate 3-phosphatidyltransferase [Chloroflexi bacterium]|nr:CDP-diacylglycerol--glycerol-3-phosphate 3-phosphatidyltransferase [Chloroflexota bacterium]
MDLPNSLTLARIIAIPAIMAFLLLGLPGGFLVAAIIFALAAATDSLDGYVARRQRRVSNFGIFLDLTADKVLVSAVLISLVQLVLLPAWVVVTIISREFIVTGIRTYAAAEGVIMPAAQWGKGKTLVTNAAITALLLGEDIKHGWLSTTPAGDFLSFMPALAWWMILAAVLLTVGSGAMYLIEAAVAGRARKRRATKANEPH